METMLDYIKETPSVLLNIINNNEDYTKQLISFYKDNNYDRIHFIASGSSYNGTLCALPFMKQILKTEISLTTPFSFENHELYHKDTMYIFVSQSGCSTNILSAMTKLKENGNQCACLVGREDSDAEKIADITINWQVGEEKIGFVTKGVSSLACFLMCFSLNLAKENKIINNDDYQHYLYEMRKTQKIQPQLLDNTISVFENNRNDFLGLKRIILLSSGPNFGTITEGALKISETCCISGQAFEAEEFLHGPLYPSTPEDLFIIVDNNDHPSSQRMIAIAKALKDVSDKVYVLSNDQSFDQSHRFTTDSESDPLVSPLYKLTCLQVLAYLITENSNHYEPHEKIKLFKKANKVASKSRANLYLDLQKIEKL